MIHPEDEERWVLDLLREARNKRFFGQVLLHIEGGHVVRINKNESLKPPNVEGKDQKKS